MPTVFDDLRSLIARLRLRAGQTGSPPSEHEAIAATASANADLALADELLAVVERHDQRPTSAIDLVDRLVRAAELDLTQAMAEPGEVDPSSVAEAKSALMARITFLEGELHLVRADRDRLGIDLQKAQHQLAEGWTHPEQVKMRISDLERQLTEQTARAEAAEAKLQERT
jgi:chromosome segregation ATPase